jgi:hypothetical protein
LKCLIQEYSNKWAWWFFSWFYSSNYIRAMDTNLLPWDIKMKVFSTVACEKNITNYKVHVYSFLCVMAVQMFHFCICFRCFLSLSFSQSFRLCEFYLHPIAVYYDCLIFYSSRVEWFKKKMFYHWHDFVSSVSGHFRTALLSYSLSCFINCR